MGHGFAEAIGSGLDPVNRRATPIRLTGCTRQLPSRLAADEPVLGAGSMIAVKAVTADDGDSLEQSTNVLLSRHRAGDAAALEALVRRYYPRVERIVRVRLGAALLERETVSDVVQD